MHRLRKGRALVAAAVVVFVLIPVGPVAHAQETGNIIRVNTTLDGIVNDANCTLREAIQSANTDTSVDACAAGDFALDIIHLQPGAIYQLTVVGENENANLTGDLDIRCPISLLDPALTCAPDDEAAGELVIEPVPPPAPPAPASPTASSLAPPVIESLSGDRIFHRLPDIILGTPAGNLVNTSGNLTIRGVVLRGGRVTGGAVFMEGNATLTLDRVTVTGNSSPDRGGGLWNEEDTVIQRSTIYGNSAAQDGGGILNTNEDGDILDIRNSTVSGNTAGRDGGGMFNEGDSTPNASTFANNTAANRGGGVFVAPSTTLLMSMANTLIGDNATGSNQGPDCFGEPVSRGNNLLESETNCTPSAGTGDILGLDPVMKPLAPNGGPTLTHAISNDSPAKDKGSSVCEAVDQRGGTRKPPCDIGSYELFVCDGLPADVIGSEGDDNIEGTGAADVIQAFAGNDVVQGLGGTDKICGGGGDDVLLGGSGSDKLKGGGGNDELQGGDAADQLQGDVGEDLLKGGIGNDVLNGEDDDDELFGEFGDDVIRGHAGDDVLDGGFDDDVMNGGQDDDQLLGQDGDDILKGSRDDDVLRGGNGLDTLVGGRGLDTCSQGRDGPGPRRSCER